VVGETEKALRILLPAVCLFCSVLFGVEVNGTSAHYASITVDEHGRDLAVRFPGPREARGVEGSLNVHRSDWVLPLERWTLCAAIPL